MPSSFIDAMSNAPPRPRTPITLLSSPAIRIGDGAFAAAGTDNWHKSLEPTYRRGTELLNPATWWSTVLAERGKGNNATRWNVHGLSNDCGACGFELVQQRRTDVQFLAYRSTDDGTVIAKWLVSPSVRMCQCLCVCVSLFACTVFAECMRVNVTEIDWNTEAAKQRNSAAISCFVNNTMSLQSV